MATKNVERRSISSRSFKFAQLSVGSEGCFEKRKKKKKKENDDDDGHGVTRSIQGGDEFVV